jgi:hypothetical protein
MISDRHDKETVIVAAVLLDLRVHELDDAIVVKLPQNGDFIPEPSDTIPPLQSLQRIRTRKRASLILDDEYNALPALIQAFLRKPAISIKPRHRGASESDNKPTLRVESLRDRKFDHILFPTALHISLDSRADNQEQAHPSQRH